MAAVDKNAGDGYGGAELGRGGLGSWASTWSSTGSVLTLNKLGLGALGGFDGMGRRGTVGGRGRALCLPGHGDGAAGVRWHA